MPLVPHGHIRLSFFILLTTDEEITFVEDEAWVHLTIGIVYYFCLTYKYANFKVIERAALYESGSGDFAAFLGDAVGKYFF